MKVLEGTGGGGSSGVDPMADRLCERFDVLLGDMAGVGDRTFVSLAARFEQRLETARLLAVARLAGGDGDARSQRRRARAHLSGDRKGRSNRSVNRDARRAAALAANPGLSEQAGNGSLSGDGIDALSKAADDTTGEIPADLLDLTSGVDPDQSARLVEQYLQEQASAANANARYEAQLAARRVRRYTVPACGAEPELAGLGIEGPDAVIEQIWALLNSEADSAYHAAGGRDRPPERHVPLDHRRFDAAICRLRGGGGPRGGSRPSVVVTIGIDDLTGPASGRRPATQIGCGPISDQLVAELAATGDLSAMVVGLDGRPLWLGRAHRHAAAAQHLALAVRDRGCVLCGAAFQRCHAHHIVPWNAPAKGCTDLENLALLCGACHGASMTGERHWFVSGRTAATWCGAPARQPKPSCHRRVRFSGSSSGSATLLGERKA